MPIRRVYTKKLNLHVNAACDDPHLIAQTGRSHAALPQALFGGARNHNDVASAYFLLPALRHLKRRKNLAPPSEIHTVALILAGRSPFI